MNRKMKVLVAALMILGLTTNAWAVDSIIFSTSNTNPTAGTSATYSSIAGAGSARTLYVWVNSNAGEDITPPDTGFTTVVIAGVNNSIPNSAAAVAFNAARTANTVTPLTLGTDVVSITGGSALNAAFTGSGATPTTNIWDSVSSFATGNANVTTTLVKDINAAVVPVASPAGINRGMALTQSVANVTNPNFVSNAFLLGQITFNTTAYGTSTLSLQPSSLGIARGATNLTNTYTYGTATITVNHKAGDTNGDGFCNLQDYVNVVNNLGTGNGTAATGFDTNDDGRVNLQDYVNVVNNLGTGNGQGASAVPEPASLALMAMAGLAILGVRAKRFVRG